MGRNATANSLQVQWPCRAAMASTFLGCARQDRTPSSHCSVYHLEFGDAPGLLNPQWPDPASSSFRFFPMHFCVKDVEVHKDLLAGCASCWPFDLTQPSIHEQFQKPWFRVRISSILGNWGDGIHHSFKVTIYICGPYWIRMDKVILWFYSFTFFQFLPKP